MQLSCLYNSVMCVPTYVPSTAVYKSHLRIYVPLNTLLKTHKSKTILNDKDTYVLVKSFKNHSQKWKTEAIATFITT